MNFDWFITATDYNRAWLMDKGLKMYVRRGVKPYHDYDFCIANISTIKPGTGRFTRFLDKWEPQFSFSVECIFNERLPAFLERRGYVYTDPNYPPTMLRITRQLSSG